MINIDSTLTPTKLKPQLEKFWALSGNKILSIEEQYDTSQGTPVFTEHGRYSSRGWTEWTQGFQYGSAILQYDATRDAQFLNIGRENTVALMAGHVSHFGVHDHGFNNVSTYGNLLRLIRENVIKDSEGQWQSHFYEMALKVSGAVQAWRWTTTQDGGYIYSFNGPHSLFIDTIRSCRSLAVAHGLGHAISAENDVRISLLARLFTHALTSAKYSVFYGEGRDEYDIRGRTAHEIIFNTNDGQYRCPNSQQGYSGFTTWTRGLAWAMLGYAEQLEFMHTLSDEEFANEEMASLGDRATLEATLLKTAEACCDFYLDYTPSDGIPYWDTGAPQLNQMENYLDRPADPNNPHEPVDSSAAVIAAQGLLRLGRYLAEGKGKSKGAKSELAERYTQAGLTVAHTLLDSPYLSLEPEHQGLVLHSIYHRPNGWDTVPANSQIPKGESSMWGDYHMRELALYLQRLIGKEPYYTFFGCLK